MWKLVHTFLLRGCGCPYPFHTYMAKTKYRPIGQNWRCGYVWLFIASVIVKKKPPKKSQPTGPPLLWFWGWHVPHRLQNVHEKEKKNTSCSPRFLTISGVTLTSSHFFLFVCVGLVDFYFGVCTFVLMPQPILFMRQVIAVPIRWIGPTYNKHIEYIEYIIFVVVVTAVARHAIRQCHLSVIESVSSLFCLLFNKCQWLVYPTAYRRNMFVSRWLPPFTRTHTHTHSQQNKKKMNIKICRKSK